MKHPIVPRLRELIRRNPFEPFTIHMVDGAKYPVPHEDFLSVSLSGQVYYDDGKKISKTLNPTLVAEIAEKSAALG
jgi:hypothetical protein